MAGKIKMKRAFVSRTGRPRRDAIEFFVYLTKDECTKSLVGEYTYTGKETADQHPYSHSTLVKQWKLVNRYKKQADCKIVKQDGNHVKFACQCVSDKICNTSRPITFIVRILLYAEMHPPDYKTTTVTEIAKEVYHEVEMPSSFDKFTKDYEKEVVKATLVELNKLEDRGVVKTVRKYGR